MTKTRTKPESSQASENWETAFHSLARQAQACTLCDRMEDQDAVLGEGNGPFDAKILFIAEAPGRFGSARTGIPFSGDKSGDNFETLLAHSGLSRNDIFITNAVLCNPIANGCNSRPTAREIKNCSVFLNALLEGMQPKLVATLGSVGLLAMNKYLGTRFELKDVAARVQHTENFALFPLYHPSPRVIHWRRTLTQQKRDFRQLVRIARALDVLPQPA